MAANMEYEIKTLAGITKHCRCFPILLLFFILFSIFSIPNFVAASALVKPPNNLGLVGYWSLNEGTGTLAGDASGNKNTGILTSGPTWVDGKKGKALNFDGADDVITSFRSSISPRGNRTICLWIKTNSTVRQGLVATRPSAAGSFGFGFTINRTAAGNLTYYENNGTHIYEVAAGITTGVWHHVCVTLNLTTGVPIMYKNGVAFTASSGFTAENSSSFNGNIGKENPDATNLFNGLIDEVRIYNRVLSAAEIRYLYQSGAARIRPSGVSFVNAASNATPTLEHASSLTVTIPATVAGNDLIVAVTSGDDPDPPVAVSSITATGATFSLVSGAEITNTHARVEMWSARNIPAGITSVTITMPSPTVFDGLVAEYSGVGSLGTVATASGASGEHPTVSLTTQDANNVVVAGFVQEGTAIGQLDPAITGVSRVHDYAAGDGFPDVPGALLDNTSALAASVTNTVTRASTVDNWAAAAVELRKATTTGRSAKVNTSQNKKLTSGLVGFWSFNGADMSGDTATDRSGQGNDGTLTNGPTRAIGKVGQALDFDGVNDFVNAGSNASLDDVFGSTGGGSISAWIFPRTVGELGALGNGIITTKGTSIWGFLMNSSNNLRFFQACTDLGGGGTNRWQTPTNSISLNTWQHVAVVYSNSSIGNQPTIYINGSKTTATQDLFADDDPCESDGINSFTIGNDSVGSHTFDGRIDEVRAYNRPLTAAEVLKLYNAGR